MIKNQKNKLSIALTLNIALVIMGVIGTVLCSSRLGNGMFVYYTTNSNLFSMLASALYVAFTGRAIAQNKPESVPKWVRVIKLMTVCCLTVTFIVVIAVLSPTSEGGYIHMLFDDELLYFHLLCPLVSIVSFIFFEINADLKVKDAIVAVIPTIIYAVIAIILNLMYVIEGPYSFLKVNKQPITMSVMWFVVIVGGALAMSCLIRYLSAKLSKK